MATLLHPISYLDSANFQSINIFWLFMCWLLLNAGDTKVINMGSLPSNLYLARRQTCEKLSVMQCDTCVYQWLDIELLLSRLLPMPLLQIVSVYPRWSFHRWDCCIRGWGQLPSTIWWPDCSPEWGLCLLGPPWPAQGGDFYSGYFDSKMVITQVTLI